MIGGEKYFDFWCNNKNPVRTRLVKTGKNRIFINYYKDKKIVLGSLKVFTRDNIGENVSQVS